MSTNNPQCDDFSAATQALSEEIRPFVAVIERIGEEILPFLEGLDRETCPRQYQFFRE